MNSMRTLTTSVMILAFTTSGCTPGIKPLPPQVTCSPVAQGKILHLFEVEDWRKDGKGPRELGEAVTLDSELSASMLVNSAITSSLACMGFKPADEGPGVPELRIAITEITSDPGAPAQAPPPVPPPAYVPAPTPAPAPAPAPGYYPQPQPQPGPAYPQPQPSPAPSAALFFPGLTASDFTTVLLQTEESEVFYPEPVAPAVPTPVTPTPAPMASPYDARPASITFNVKVAFFYPPATQMFSENIIVTRQGMPLPANKDNEAAMEQYNQGLAIMVTNALNEIGNQVVLLFTSHADLMMNLPTAPPVMAAPMPAPGPAPGPGPSPYPQPMPQPQPVPGPGPSPYPQPQPQPVPGPQPQPVPGPQPQPQPPPGPALPITATPQMKAEIKEIFQANMEVVWECLANADLGIPATVGIEINPDGSVKNWGCKEDGLKGEAACGCIIQPIIDNNTFWPTQEGFKYIHVYN